ncbi:aromatic alcohol reductase [Aspergillus undulatus]|uniref:aromatic alcohol reductase n=1 Tax=Aspergillus undulatus TaxID=1810928 RepID=UPI003CCD1E78
MAQPQKYAKDQPSDFTNRIERVAIVGAGGSVGKPIAQELLKTGQHTVTALTRKDSTSPLPDGVKAIHVDYNDEDALVVALKDQQCLIITLAVTVPPETEGKLIRAAALAGVPYVMPNTWGGDIENERLRKDVPIIGEGYKKACDAIEAEGVASWIALACGFWYEFSLVTAEESFGFNFQSKKVTFYDDGKTKINVSTWEQCGRAVASLLSLKELPEDENDQRPTLSNWRNKPVYIDSFLVSQRDMFESWKRVSGDKDEDWTVAFEPSADRWARGVELLKKGDRAGLVMAMYARVFYPNGDGNYAARNGLHNDLLALPKEELDDRTAVAKGMLERGYSYLGNRV